MNLKSAINASPIWAARGFEEDGACVCSLAYYGETLMWLNGLGGNWDKKWKLLSDDDKKLISHLDFKPFGPKQEDDIEEDILSAITEIHRDEDEFEPMGETYE